MNSAASRLLSLDAFRGMTMAAMILVNNSGTYRAVYRSLMHAPWNGWMFADTIFPAFLFIMGVSVVFSPPPFVLRYRNVKGNLFS